MKRVNNKEKGFSILAVILVIVAVIVAIGVWALSGQTNTSASGNSSSDIQAAAIINDSSGIKVIFDMLVVNGTDPEKIILKPNITSTSTVPNMADPKSGFQITKLNSKFLNANPDPNAGLWMYKDLMNSQGKYSKVLMISGLNESICKSINFQLEGVSAIPILLNGSNERIWSSPDYDTGSYKMGQQLYLDSINTEAITYDGKGDINVYNKFVTNLNSSLLFPRAFCIGLSVNGEDNFIYAYYRVLK